VTSSETELLCAENELAVHESTRKSNGLKTELDASQAYHPIVAKPSVKTESLSLRLCGLRTCWLDMD
jgi:hypothetical protein